MCPCQPKNARSQSIDSSPRRRSRREHAARVVDDLIELLDETVEQFVQRRHAELQREGLRNEEIFGRLADECATWRFRAPTLSPRQLRRIVYG